MLAQAVTKAMGERGWSIRAAAAYTGNHENTIDRMKKGLGVEPEALIRFGRGVAEKGKETETARFFLKAAGKSEIVALIDAATREAVTGDDEQIAAGRAISADGEIIEVVSREAGTVSFQASEDSVAVIAHVMRAVEKARGTP